MSGIAITVLGIPSAFDTEILGAVDSIANNIFLLGGGLALSIFVGWIMSDPVGEVREGAEGVRWFFLWRFLLRFVCPAVLVFVFWFGLQDTVAVVKGLFGAG